MGVMRELQAIAKELEAMKANSGRTPTSGNSEVILTPAESPDPSLPSVNSYLLHRAVVPRGTQMHKKPCPKSGQNWRKSPRP